MARELRDRWLEQVNTGEVDGGLVNVGKYDICRTVEAVRVERAWTPALPQLAA